MRDILFRGKRKDNGEWIVGTPIIYEDGRTRIIESHTDVFCYVKDSSIIQTVAHEVDPETVGQFTGLYDNTKWDDLTEEEREDFTIAGNFPSEWKGKKIFEGDIVEHHVQGDILVNRGVIVWDERNGCWLHQLNTMRPTLYMFNSKAWKIIGTIHDKPEILEN